MSRETRPASSVLASFPFLTIRSLPGPALLAQDQPSRSPSGSYWYAGFPVSHDPTSRDDFTLREAQAFGQEHFGDLLAFAMKGDLRWITGFKESTSGDHEVTGMRRAPLWAAGRLDGRKSSC